MKSTLTVFLAFNILALISFGNHPPVMEIESKIDSIVKLQFEPNQPGGVIAIVGPEGAIFKKSYGMADLDKQIENSEKTIFDIASLAKQFTAFGLLLLKEQGDIYMDDNIILHLPDFKPYPHKVTIRNLLQHTAGIPSTDVVRLVADLPFDMVWTQENEINLIKQYPYLNFEPGSEFLYSNAGYSLLANIIENISGVIFPDYLTEYIFQPLGMSSSFVLHQEVENQENFANGYRKTEDSFEVFSDRSDLSYGGGSIFTNLSDMVAWGRNILSPKVGPANFLQMISMPYNTLNDGDTIYYTYGFNVRNHKGLKMVEHSGGVPGFRNQFMIFPEHEIIIILMFNNQSINTRQIANGIADLMLADHFIEETILEPVTIEIDIETAKAFEGYYLMPDGMEFGFFIDEGAFWFVVQEDRFQLSALSDREYLLKEFNARCNFILGEDRNASHLEWLQGGKSILAPKIDQVVSINPDELSMFAGNYIQPELKITYPVVLEDGILIIKTPDTFKKYLGFGEVPLTHVNGDKFYGSWFDIVEFTRDENKVVNGFVIRDLGRLKNIRFVR